ncbi:MAG: hypothetical protein IT422_27980 [Pirellulaceae bacterium]|jgi:hypothetical protein|nr:hypothetical protein [Pirellulaceae bacterium]
MPFDRLNALMLLSECSGDDIWSPEHCRQRGVPLGWIEELSDSYESGFGRNTETIYLEDRVINQYHGLRDVDLAIKLGEYLGVDVQAVISRAASRRHLVRLIHEAIEEE